MADKAVATYNLPWKTLEELHICFTYEKPSLAKLSRAYGIFRPYIKTSYWEEQGIASIGQCNLEKPAPIRFMVCSSINPSLPAGYDALGSPPPRVHVWIRKRWILIADQSQQAGYTSRATSSSRKLDVDILCLII